MSGRIYITGDCHAEFGKFSTKRFPEQKELTKEDFVIVCGDFGLWDDCNAEKNNLEWLSEKNFTTLFVDGNHENFDRLYSDEFETVDFHGGKAQKIRDSIYHLKRGNVFTLCGKKIFAFGGASSHDIKDGILEPEKFSTRKQLMDRYLKLCAEGKLVRINHISWWEKELPDEEEMDFGIKTLEKHNNEVDFIISHCCPQEIVSVLSHGFYKPDQLTSYFDEINRRIKFEKWFFGHYHGNQTVYNKYIMLYNNIERVV